MAVHALRGSRAARYDVVSSALAKQDDDAIAELLAAGTVAGTGIGGTSTVLDVGGVAVFAKRIPLTDTERRPDTMNSTANIFELPAYCHYGVGSPGFGVWRELAANVEASDWVLAGRSEAFPLLYHWRVLPGAPPLAEAYVDVERGTAFWGGGPGIRRRLHEIAAASASVVLFLEYVPMPLPDWLRERAADPESLGEACAMVESRLLADAAFLRANGMTHFDLHFNNILTDGHRLYLADFGLVASSRFAMSAEERAFVRRHRDYDLGETLVCLVNWLVTNVVGIPGNDVAARDEYIRACSDGGAPGGVPVPVTALIRRYAPVAAVMNDFFRDLFGVSRTTPYPADRMRRALAVSRAYPGTPPAGR